MVEPAAVVLLYFLAICWSGCTRWSWGYWRFPADCLTQGAEAALVFADVVVADHEDDPSPVKVTGLNKIDMSKPHVCAVNHASALDIPVLYAYLPFQFRIVFKKELLSYPIVGWQLKRSGQVCIDQQKPTNSIAAIRSAVKSLKAGMPLVIFPEGGRTPDGEIKPFLPGAFFLAIKARVDIVPVALVGTYELLPMNTYHIKCRPLQMRVGEPISTAGMTMRDLEAVSAKVRKALEDLYYAESPVQA